MAVRASLLAGVLALALASGAGAARAATVPRSAGPLPGSSFQGGDGNQDDQAPYVDWQGFQAASRVVHNPDPNEHDSAFVSGLKEDEPGEWAFTTETGGVRPAKDNILDAWSSVDQPAGDTFLYLAFTRGMGALGRALGTSYVSFELNQDARLWNNGRAEIPCRRTGDVLVVVASHGNEVEIVLERWTSTVNDAATGCATRGHLTRVTSVPASDAQGAANTAPIVSRLPGFYAPGTAIDDGLFAEAALNISALLQQAFQDSCFAFASVWMHSRSSLSENSNLQDYVAPRALALRTCSASGTKFLDLNANGERDSGEPGIPRFLIWADYDNDGVRDANEPFSVTDASGRYVITDIAPPGGSYRLRETLVAGRSVDETSWVCSHPHDGTPGGFGNGPGGLFACGWGPIDANAIPYAQARDFGDWLPAQLTLEKQLWPADDPGRFDLVVNGVTVLPAAGDGATTTIDLRPGSYDISEVAVPPTNAADYDSTVSCRATTRRRRQLRSGAAYTGLVLRAGGHASCTFVNVRPGTPAIAIEKTGPTTATAGDTLRYALYVTNPGHVPIPASTVEVTDSRCDHAPKLSHKSGPSGADASPDTLDPGDTWTYRCSHRTTVPSTDCTVSTVTNAATATGAAAGTTVTDDDSITTTLNCPDEPPQPPLPEPVPPGPTPSPVPNPIPGGAESVAPPGPSPPPAGQIGTAGLRVSRACVRRASEVRLVGTRIAAVSVRVDGRTVGRRTLAILQRGTTLLHRLFGAGRHRLSVRVRFQRGSGTPPETLTRAVTVCAAARPNFTG